MGITYVHSFDGLGGFVYASDTVCPSELDEKEVNKRIKERIEGELRFYDGITHKGMFSIPKHIRSYLERENRISTNNNLVAMPE